MTTGKNIALTIRTFVSKVMSLIFNMPSRFAVAFLPRSKRLLISWLQSLSGECVLLGSVSSQQRFGATDIKAPGASQLSGLGQTLLWLLDKSVLQLYFSQKIAGESILKAWGPADPKTWREERGGAHQCAQRRGRALWLFFSYVFPSRRACPMQAGLARSAVCPTWSPQPGPRTFLWPSVVLIFAGFSLSCLLATAILDSCFLF